MESETKTVKAVADYIAEVSRLVKTGRTTEHSFRGAFAALDMPGDEVLLKKRI